MKILKTVLICIFIVMLLSQNIFAIGEVFNTADSWKEAAKEHEKETLNTTKLKDASDNLYHLLLAVAIGVAVVVGAILGVKFMTAGIDKKVEVKESLFPYLISCIVVFGSLGIWKLVVTLLKMFD